MYQDVVIDLPELPSELFDYLPLYTSFVTELGCGEHDYQAMQRWQQRVSSGIGASFSFRNVADGVPELRSCLVVSGKALNVNYSSFSELLMTTIDQVRFDEIDRITDLLKQKQLGSLHSITQNGHRFAMLVASAGLTPASHWQEWLGGLHFVQRLNQIETDKVSVTELANKLSQIHQLVLKQPRRVVMVAEQDHLSSFVTSVSDAVNTEQDYSDSVIEPTQKSLAKQQAWVVDTQVSFCAKAYQTVNISHADGPALMVLSMFLRNGYLHRVVREQGGAYGGGASYDVSTGLFKFYSYRDPRLTETLADFDQSLVWLQTAKEEGSQVEEAILGIVSQLDSPLSPAAKGFDDFFNQYFGYSDALRDGFRQDILKVTFADLQRVAQQYLEPNKANVAVVTNQQSATQLADSGFEINQVLESEAVS